MQVEIITGILALIGVGFGTWATLKRGNQSDKVSASVAKETNAIEWSKQLLGRLEKLEDKVENQSKDIKRLSRVFTVSLNFIEEFLLWARDGSKPPIPTIPDSLKEHLDPSLINEHRRQHRESVNPENHQE